MEAVYIGIIAFNMYEFGLKSGSTTKEVMRWPGSVAARLEKTWVKGVYLIGMSLIGVYLIGVCLIGVYLISVCLTGVHVTGVHLIDRTSRVYTSWTCVS
jgi:hypothetical protein